MKEPVIPEEAFNLIDLIDKIKWPVVVIIAILIFRKPVVNLINRVTKVGYGDKSLEANQQTMAIEKKTEEISHIDRVVGLFRHETIDTFKAAILNESEIENLNTPEEKVDRLTNYSCLLYIMRHFDIIYNLIYGSQIKILQHINSHAGTTRESIKFYYENAKRNNPNFYDTYSYEEYLDFLFNHTLIGENNGILHITVLGVDFLKYLTESNKDTNKWN